MGTASAIQPASLFSIGMVLAELQRAFPDITISKIRFLESEGLVEPIRTPSGYRKFSPRDIERLHYILRMQRDHFLPLRVIADHLQAIDRGLTPPPVGDAKPRIPSNEVNDDVSVGDHNPNLVDVRDQVRISREELSAECGFSIREMVAIEEASLIRPLPGERHYGIHAAATLRTIAQLRDLGLGLRHLAVNRRAADQQFERIEAFVNAARPNRNSPVPDKVRLRAQRLAKLQLQLHADLLRAALAELVTEFGPADSTKSNQMG